MQVCPSPDLSNGHTCTRVCALSCSRPRPCPSAKLSSCRQQTSWLFTFNCYRYFSRTKAFLYTCITERVSIDLVTLFTIPFIFRSSLFPQTRFLCVLFCVIQDPFQVHILHLAIMFPGLPRWLSGKEPSCQCRRRGFHLWVGKIPWRRKWQPTPVFLPGKSHGQRRWTGYGPWGHKESDTT